MGILCIFAATEGRCSLFSQEMFGLENDMIHPFISVTGEYTDNLFSTTDNEKDDIISRVTPGLWLALPGADAEVINIATSSSAPGGMALTCFQREDMGRYQAFLWYAPTFENYVDYSERDIITHKLSAYAALNMKSGLSFELLDQYKDNRDAVEEQTDSAEYNNNMVSLTAAYLITEKLKARLDARYYDVNYDSKKPEKDRADTSVSGYAFFTVMPKTSVFGEVTHVNIDYDTANKDGKELKVYGGVKYNATDRLNAMIKAGYMNKKLDDTGDTHDTASFEGQLAYELTDRIDLIANGSRQNRESFVGRYITENMAQLTGIYELTTHISGALMLMVSDESYEAIDRDDTTYKIAPSVKYVLNNRVHGSLSYSYTDKNASGTDSGSQSDYSQNSVMLSVTASM
jgi:hypothetical protein